MKCPICGCDADYFVYDNPFDTTPEHIAGCDECAPNSEED